MPSLPLSLFSTSAPAAATIFLYTHSLIFAPFELVLVTIMIFPSLSMSLLGFAAVASAGKSSDNDGKGPQLNQLAPHLHSRYERSVAKRELGPLAERGLGWVSRDTSGLYSRQKGDRGRGNNVNVAADITITELSVDVVDQKKRGDDVVLVQLIQQRLLVIDNSEQFKDNVRRNTFRNKNQNVVCTGLI